MALPKYYRTRGTEPITVMAPAYNSVQVKATALH